MAERRRWTPVTGPPPAVPPTLRRPRPRWTARKDRLATSRRRTGPCSTHSPHGPPTRLDTDDDELMARVDAGRSPAKLPLPGQARPARHPVDAPRSAHRRRGTRWAGPRSGPPARHRMRRRGGRHPALPGPHPAWHVQPHRRTHLLLDPAGEPKARKALRKLGYHIGSTIE
jgi:hypothetical protein